jgi:Trk-type K+ transport system membrane component
LLIALGTLVLRLPAVSSGGEPLEWSEAFFLATSAATVTGLSTIDVATQLSAFGQIVIALIVQLGGLGIMGATFGVLVLIGRRLSFGSLIAAREELGSIATPRGMRRILLHLVVVTVVIEAVGAAIMFARLITLGEGLSASLRGAILNAVTAFCNSGFDVFPQGGATYNNDIVIMWTIALLIVLGGLGFPVLIEVWRLMRHPGGKGTRRPRTSLTAKLVIVGTAALTALGVVSFVAFEWNNPATLGGMSFHERVAVTPLMGVTARTAGFAPIPMTDLEIGTLFSYVFLMFVGTGPVSTGGGIKVTTMLVVALVVLAQARGDAQPRAFGRAITQSAVGRAMTIIVFAAGWVLLGTFALVELERINVFAALFESVSAFGTVGLTLDVTPGLSLPGQLVACILMFVGRVGPITVAAALAHRGRAGRVRYPDEEVALG